MTARARHAYADKPPREPNPNEDFPTPDWCIKRMIERVDLPTGGRWLEPCAGHGSIIETIGTSHAITWSAVELQPKYEAPLRALVDRGRPGARVAIGDFLAMHDTEARGVFAYDVAITNPPFSLSVDFFKRMRVIAPIVVLLLRMNWLGSQARYEMLRNDMPREIWAIPNRPSFRQGKRASSDSTEYAWMVWRRMPVTSSEFRLLSLTPKEERAATKKRDAERREREGW